MMKKWFFSDNGKVTSPLSHTEALTYLTDKPNAYGWHPSFSQWKPISCIPEFADIVSLPEQSSLVTKELTDKFLAKKLRLEAKLSSIEDSINHTEATFNKFEKQISSYKTLTQNLSDEVKGAISNIEKKYDSLNKKIAQVKNAVSIAEVEMNDAVKGFDNRANSNDVSMPSCHNIDRVIATTALQTPNIEPSKISDASLKAANVEAKNTNATDEGEKAEAQISKAKLAQTKLATPHKLWSLNTKEDSKNEFVTDKTEKIKRDSNIVDTENVNKEAKESFNGMKSMMKSVFKAEKKTESDSKDQPMSMAERLKMAQNNG